jgi:hypothetical protein
MHNRFRNADRLLLGGDMIGYSRFELRRFQHVRHTFAPIRWREDDTSPGYTCMYCDAELFQGAVDQVLAPIGVL